MSVSRSRDSGAFAETQGWLDADRAIRIAAETVDKWRSGELPYGEVLALIDLAGHLANNVCRDWVEAGDADGHSWSWFDKAEL